MIRLTDEQVLAVTAPERLVNIVSAPGSGKTTVAAARFGYQRFQRGDLRGVLGLTFNRTAAAELSARIRSRWGNSALAFPHRVMTFDALHVAALEHLLTKGLVSWPKGHTTLEVRDDFRGERGYRFLRPPSNWRRVATLNQNRRVVSGGAEVSTPTGGIGNKAQHDALLRAGITCHEDVRSVLLAAMKVDDLKSHVSDWLSNSFRALVVDEVYDAALLDLHVAFLAAETGLLVTLVGDPWQALYGWRGASPDKVEELLKATTDKFESYQQSVSFRFVGDQMPELTRALRAGEAVTLPEVESTEVDVALGRQWRPLWRVGDNVLPLAFRTVDNATDAALNLLLDVLTRAHFSTPSFGRESAIAHLGLDRDRLRVEQDAVMRPLLDDLRTGKSPTNILDALRGSVQSLGAPRRPNRLQGPNEAARVDDLAALSRRLSQASLVPGLTVYQAKGREWPRVGVALTRAQRDLLNFGLVELGDDDCVIYVAITRAMKQCGLLRDELTLDLDAVNGETA